MSRGCHLFIVQQIATAYEVRGMVQTVTSYDNATPGGGTVLNQVQLTYNVADESELEKFRMKSKYPRQPVFAMIAFLGCLNIASARSFVVPVTVDNLVRMPADFFDLQGRTVRFAPGANGGYLVQTLQVCHPVQCSQRLEDAAGKGPWYAKGWSVSLPFQFPFGGKSWDHIYVNMDGNISFEKPESDYWPDRNPWADAGMYSVAAAIDARSFAGFEKMIAVFWGPYQNPTLSQISVDLRPDCVSITWNMTRAAWGQAVLGVNTFQARLYPSGVIEFTYPHIAEKDGIVGLFTGQQVKETRLDHWHPEGSAPVSTVDIDSTDVYDAGTVLDLAFTMKHDAVTRVDSGPLDYRCWVHHDGIADLVTLSVSDQERMTCWLGAAPLTGGWCVNGRRVDLYVSKVLLTGCKKMSTDWDVTWWGNPGYWETSGTRQESVDMTSVAPACVKFVHANESHTGNIFEVFHYPVVTRASERLLGEIYKKRPARDDIAIVFTDFRIDDLYGQGAGAIAANFGIQGIGKENEHPRSTKYIGSTQLQMSVATVWIGAPKFDPFGVEDDGTKWFNFAHGVKWVAHECTHRWGMDMSFRNPQTGQEEKLTDNVGHWREGLDTTALYPVWDLFQLKPGVGPSVMGGYTWRQNPDKTYSQNLYSFQIPAGYSALDLYVMGMLPPERVPPTFMLENLKELAWNRFSGSTVPVRISDVVKVMGKRIPTFANSQKLFHMTFYLAHEPGHDADQTMLKRAEALSVAVARYFERATGNVMKVVPVED